MIGLGTPPPRASLKSKFLTFSRGSFWASLTSEWNHFTQCRDFENVYSGNPSHYLGSLSFYHEPWISIMSCCGKPAFCGSPSWFCWTQVWGKRSKSASKKHLGLVCFLCHFREKSFYIKTKAVGCQVYSSFLLGFLNNKFPHFTCISPFSFRAASARWVTVGCAFVESCPLKSMFSFL